MAVYDPASLKTIQDFNEPSFLLMRWLPEQPKSHETYIPPATRFR